jgi:hypothetical protein
VTFNFYRIHGTKLPVKGIRDVREPSGSQVGCTYPSTSTGKHSPDGSVKGKVITALHVFPRPKQETIVLQS